MEINITQKLNELDTQAFTNDEKCYDLSYLYESQNIPQDKKKRIVEELTKEKVDTKSIYNILTEDFNLGNEDLHDEVFTARAYYGTNYSGLEDDIETTDYSELEDFVWEKLQKGFLVEADGLDGLVHRYSPDKVEWGEETFGIEDYLVESVVAEQSDDPKFTRDEVRNLAEKFIKLAEEDELYPELWDYSVTEDGNGKIVLFIDGDWKHDHLALDWLFQDFYMKENFKCVSSVTTETDSDGGDWFGGTHTYIIKNEPFMTTETITESVDEPQDADDIRSYITNKKKFTNGTVAEFNPQSLVDKVAETGYSLNSIREDSEGNEYYISVHYKEWYGPRGIDNPDEVYYVDVVKETPDGNQTRLFTKDGTATEIVKILNDWKASVK